MVRVLSEWEGCCETEGKMEGEDHRLRKWVQKSTKTKETECESICCIFCCQQFESDLQSLSSNRSWWSVSGEGGWICISALVVCEQASWKTGWIWIMKTPQHQGRIHISQEFKDTSDPSDSVAFYWLAEEAAWGNLSWINCDYRSTVFLMKAFKDLRKVAAQPCFLFLLMLHIFIMRNCCISRKDKTLHCSWLKFQLCCNNEKPLFI